MCKPIPGLPIIHREREASTSDLTSRRRTPPGGGGVPWTRMYKSLLMMLMMMTPMISLSKSFIRRSRQEAETCLVSHIFDRANPFLFHVNDNDDDDDGDDDEKGDDDMRKASAVIYASMPGSRSGLRYISWSR